MTANPFAALLDGVLRYDVSPVFAEKETHDGIWMREADVLAALAAAVTADLAEAGKVLEGVTPGPWETVFDRQTWGWLEVDGPSFKIGAPTRATDLSLADEVQRKKDARFIAWCREGVPALLARLAAQEAQIATMIDPATVQKMLDDAQPIMAEACRGYEEALAAERAKVAKLKAAVEAAAKIGRIIGFLGEDEDRIEAFREACGPELLAKARAAITEAGHE